MCGIALCMVTRECQSISRIGKKYRRNENQLIGGKVGPTLLAHTIGKQACNAYLIRLIISRMGASGET